MSSVDAPLNAIVTDDALRKYKRIFNFLWGFKRVEQALPPPPPFPVLTRQVSSLPSY